MENNHQSEKTNFIPGMTPGQRIIFIWGPVLLKWAISMGVSMIAGVMIAFRFVIHDSKNVINMINDQDALIEFAQRTLVKYTTPIEGAAALITIFVMLYMIHKDDKSEMAYGIVPNKKAPLMKYWMVIIISGMTSMALNNLILIGNLSRYSEAYEQVSEALFSPGLAVQIICLCFLVPIAEELVFRGIVYRRIRWESRASVAVFYSAAIFAVLHGNLIQGIFGFLMGILFGYLREKFGSVLAPVMAHIVANLLTVLSSEYGLYQWEMSDIRLIGGVTVACAVVSTMVYLAVRGINERPEMI